jgi:hypothetical protein
MNATTLNMTTVGDRIVKDSEGPLPFFLSFFIYVDPIWSSRRWIDLVEQNQTRPTYAALKNKQRRALTRPASARPADRNKVEAAPRWPKRAWRIPVSQFYMAAGATRPNRVITS